MEVLEEPLVQTDRNLQQFQKKHSNLSTPMFDTLYLAAYGAVKHGRRDSFPRSYLKSIPESVKSPLIFPIDVEGRAGCRTFFDRMHDTVAADSGAASFSFSKFQKNKLLKHDFTTIKAQRTNL